MIAPPIAHERFVILVHCRYADALSTWITARRASFGLFWFTSPTNISFSADRARQVSIRVQIFDLATW